MAARFVVHLRLEGVLVLHGNRPRRRGASADLVDQPLEIRILAPVLLADHERHHPRPSPHIHVDDGVGLADHVIPAGQPLVQHLEMPLRFEHIAVHRIGELLRREMPEVHRLPGIRTDAGRGEHQPGQELTTHHRRVRRQELPGLFGEIQQDGVAVENHRVAVDDRGNLGIRIDLEIVRLEPVSYTHLDVYKRQM